MASDEAVLDFDPLGEMDQEAGGWCGSSSWRRTGRWSTPSSRQPWRPSSTPGHRPHPVRRGQGGRDGRRGPGSGLERRRGHRRHRRPGDLDLRARPRCDAVRADAPVGRSRHHAGAGLRSGRRRGRGRTAQAWRDAGDADAGRATGRPRTGALRRTSRRSSRRRPRTRCRSTVRPPTPCPSRRREACRPRSRIRPTFGSWRSPRAGSFVDEVRSSLEFYTAQMPNAQIGRVLVVGEVPGSTGCSSCCRSACRSRSTAAGCSSAPSPRSSCPRRRPPRPRPCCRSPSAWRSPPGGTREPGQPPSPELRERQAIRRTTSLVVAAGLAVLALIGIFYFFQVQRLSQTQSDLEAQQSRNAQLESRDRLAPAVRRPAGRAGAEGGARRRDLRERGVLVERAPRRVPGDPRRVLPDEPHRADHPDDRGQVATEPTGGTPETTLIGNMTFAGVANQTETIATWITRLEEVQGWVNAWVNSAQEDVPFSRIYTFSNGLDLTQEAATARGQGWRREPARADHRRGHRGARGPPARCSCSSCRRWAR